MMIMNFKNSNEFRFLIKKTPKNTTTNKYVFSTHKFAVMLSLCVFNQIKLNLFIFCEGLIDN